MSAFFLPGAAGLCVLAALSISTPALSGQDGAGEADSWRRVTSSMPAGASGVTVWIDEAVIVESGAARPEGQVIVLELMIHHGETRLAGQAYTLSGNVYDCGEGFMLRGPVTVHDAAGGALLTAEPEESGPLPLIPHSIENEIWRAACSSDAVVRDHPRAQTIEAAIAHDDPAPFPDIEPAREIAADIDRDGQGDLVRIAMRPHSYRHDVEVIFLHTPNRALNIIAAQQPPGPDLTERAIRPAAPGRYVYDCLIDAEGEAAEPCAPGIAHAGRGGIEIVAEGQPSILIYDPHLGRAPVRLPQASE